MTTTDFRPEGWPCVAPRIVVDDPEQLVGFIRELFGASGRYNEARPTELRIGDSMIMISASDGRDRHNAFLYVYVPDTDRCYQLALQNGGTSIEEPRDLPYGDRRAMIRDPWGNTWQIATHSGRFTP